MRHLPRHGLAGLPPTADSWDAVRRLPRHTDEALTGTARAWLRTLPTGRRPLQRCTRFPRLANLITWHWPDPVQAHELLGPAARHLVAALRWHCHLPVLARPASALRG